MTPQTFFCARFRALYCGTLVRVALACAAIVYVAPAPAAAQAIHTCIDAKGRRTYQNAPCPAGQRTVQVREYATATVDPALAARSRAVEQEMDRRNRSANRTAVVYGRGGRSRQEDDRDRKRAECESAKRRRDKTLERVGLDRTYDLLSRLDNAVWEACKGL